MKKIVLFLFCILLLVTSARAAFDSHVPLTDDELAEHRFPLDPVPIFKNPDRPSPRDFLEQDGSIKVWSLDAGLGSTNARPLAQSKGG